MIPGGGGILIGGEDSASVIMAATMGDIMVGTMTGDIIVEDILVEDTLAVAILVQEALGVDTLAEEAMAVDMGNSWV